ncbi:MAG: hypothetical protein K8S24_02250 [Candidatus Aegiribacteria sp.]|nr:hypothetical protein [Candidatus Aegiribacteria sp.]
MRIVFWRSAFLVLLIAIFLLSCSDSDSEAGFSTCGIANVCLLGENYGFDNGFDYYSCHKNGYGRAAVSVDSLN